MLMYYYILALLVLSHKWKCWKIERRIKIKELRRQRIYHLICESDVKCINDLRMDRRTFHILCDMLRDIGGLRGTRNTPLEEIVAAFLHTLAHHVKNRTMGGFFLRSGETVSRNFNACLLAVLKLHQLLLKKPEPIPEGCIDFRWKHFKSCLGALDGTHVKVTVPTKLKGRYRSRKGEIVTNVLGVCAPTCSLYMSYLVGRVLHMTSVCFKMPSRGRMDYVSLKVAIILLMLVTQMQMVS